MEHFSLVHGGKSDAVETSNKFANTMHNSFGNEKGANRNSGENDTMETEPMSTTNKMNNKES